MATKTKQITPEQYAWTQGWTVQNVYKHYRKTGTQNLPNVIDVLEYSRFYVMIVPFDLYIPASNPKKSN